MSVINTVLRELDLRHAVGAGERAASPVPVRAVGARRPSRPRRAAFWVAPVVAAAAAWSVLPAQWLPSSSRGLGARLPAEVTTAREQVVASTAPDSQRDMAGKLPTERARPDREPRPDAIWGQPLPDARKGLDEAPKTVVPPVRKPVPRPEPVATPSPETTRRVPVRAGSVPPITDVAKPSSAPTGTIERKLHPLTSRQRADLTFRAGTKALREGRVTEAEARFRAALEIQPDSIAPREALLGVMLEAGRRGEARQLMTEGLRYAPAHATFAVVAARLMVDEGDLPGALGVLEEHDAAGRSNAEYQALAAGLLQRLGRHAEAVRRYSMALALGDDRAVWRMGRAISYRELGRAREANEDFRRSLDSGALSPEVRRYVERQIDALHAGG
ncbi:MAG: hypothetical protein GC151_05750 [Betaproteobacteria bacterium]|nr:hypothetical protein [Betaproteobacteria bacterium]